MLVAGHAQAWARRPYIWQALGFTPVDRDELAAALGRTHQVRLFAASGQLEYEVAWSRDLTALAGGAAD